MGSHVLNEALKYDASPILTLERMFDGDVKLPLDGLYIVPNPDFAAASCTSEQCDCCVHGSVAGIAW